jgi:lambda repressor-like predicted transcriptional regulator
LVCTIVAETLGFKNASAYVKCRGWTLHKKGDLNKLQYRKLENVFDELAPNGEAALLAKNLHAMVKEIYGVFEDDKIKHIYSDLPAIPLLRIGSFISKLHQYAQEFQIGLIVVKRFFMVVVPHHKSDPEYWMKQIFESCKTHYDYLTFCHNCFSLFPKDQGRPKLAKKLLTKFLKNMRDEVYRRASAKDHQRKYAKRIEESLLSSRGTRSDAMPLPNKELLLCRARARDLYFATLTPEDRAEYVTTTRRSRPRKKQKTTDTTVVFGK